MAHDKKKVTGMGKGTAAYAKKYGKSKGKRTSAMKKSKKYK